MAHQINGAKNSALAVLAAALLCPDAVEFNGIPNLTDVHSMRQVLHSVGARTAKDGSRLVVDSSSLTSASPSPTAAAALRASVFVLGPLLARLREAVVPLPGGCNIGQRPIELHLQGLQALGAMVEVHDDRVHVQAPAGLTGAVVNLRYPSVGATLCVMMAAVLAQGETTIHNAACEPEVEDVANFLSRPESSAAAAASRAAAGG
ncbi:hypothetical protein WJX72_007773 [[Myrmecia] bisecta]|uniref:UDP-N-acetylglucosamine 1-carboxyvinyltransferase n=1 Tax=[Myrmecia] bisecta TaxID=41462 RepID=A0AAW1PLP4_9CHLO